MTSPLSLQQSATKCWTYMENQRRYLNSPSLPLYFPFPLPLLLSIVPSSLYLFHVKQKSETETEAEKAPTAEQPSQQTPGELSVVNTNTVYFITHPSHLQ